MKKSKFIGNIGKFSLYESDGRGRSGNAANETKSIQVRKYEGTEGFTLEKSFSYILADPIAKNRALEKAKAYCQKSQ